MNLLISILSNLGIVGPAFGYTIGRAIFEVINNLMISIISPLFSYFIGDNISKTVIKIGKIKFNIGLFLESIINLLLILFVILFTLRFVFKDLIKAVIKDDEKHDRKIIDLLKQLVMWRIPL